MCCVNIYTGTYVSNSCNNFFSFFRILYHQRQRKFMKLENFIQKGKSISYRLSWKEERKVFLQKSFYSWKCRNEIGLHIHCMWDWREISSVELTNGKMFYCINFPKECFFSRKKWKCMRLLSCKPHAFCINRIPDTGWHVLFAQLFYISVILILIFFK